tara:strand:+ start:3256 stop:3702 length:447 start_codon:yes stop_codon:yes gene_type:complete
MRIAVGSDHRGFITKKTVIDCLKKKKHDVVDVGTCDEETCDYPDFAAAAARLVHSGSVDLAVLICNTGMGMAVTANKFPGVYACVCNSEFEAERARQHNNSNCMCIPSQLSDPTLCKMLEYFTIKTFGEGRHARRINKIKAIEDEFSS